MYFWISRVSSCPYKHKSVEVYIIAISDWSLLNVIDQFSEFLCWQTGRKFAINLSLLSSAYAMHCCITFQDTYTVCLKTNVLVGRTIVFLKYASTEDLKSGRKQLWWEKQIRFYWFWLKNRRLSHWHDPLKTTVISVLKIILFQLLYKV